MICGSVQPVRFCAPPERTCCMNAHTVLRSGTRCAGELQMHGNTVLTSTATLLTSVTQTSAIAAATNTFHQILAFFAPLQTRTVTCTFTRVVLMCTPSS
jgi:hypothetical protein